MVVRHHRRGARTRFLIESLESRINLSGALALAAPAPSFQHATVTPAQSVDMTSLVGDTGISSTSATSVPVTGYSSISNARVEYRDGSSTPDIGYMTTTGVSISYSLNAAAAGSYKLNLGVASALGFGSFDVYVNGARAAQYSFMGTGSWSNYTGTSQNINLNAGANNVTFIPTWGSQFNINAITVTPANVSPLAVITPAGPTSSGNATTLASSATISPDKYSAISNSQLEYINGKPDIGYVSLNGASVDYTLNVQTAGNYSLTASVAAMNAAGFTVLVNGTATATFSVPAGGSWSNFQPVTNSVYLPAGTVTLRFASKVGTQYNLGAISLASASATVTPAVQPAVQPAASSASVSISSSWMTSFNQLNVTGGSANDSIYVSQSGDTLTINANGVVSTYSASGYGDLVIKGGDGNDTITVDSSVKIDTLVYGQGGNDTLKDATQGHGTIVSVGGGWDTLTGNGWNTSFWADSSDQVNAAASESNGGHVHLISGFWGGVSTELQGQNLSDPSGGSGTTRLTSNSLWGTGPTMADVTQGSVSDCYLLGPLQTMANMAPDRLRELAVDLGDGTYAVQFKRGGTTTYVRVDGDLPAGGWWSYGLSYAHPGASGNQWMPIIEKAYAEFRTGAWSYDSLNSGNFNAVLSDFGQTNVTGLGYSDANTLYNNLQTALSAGKGVTIGTITGINNGAPLIGSHTYTATSVWKDAYGNAYVTLRNPWGFDGAGSDSNTNDGMVTMSVGQLQSNILMASILT